MLCCGSKGLELIMWHQLSRITTAVQHQLQRGSMQRWSLGVPWLRIANSLPGAESSIKVVYTYTTQPWPTSLIQVNSPSDFSNDFQNDSPVPSDIFALSKIRLNPIIFTKSWYIKHCFCGWQVMLQPQPPWPTRHLQPNRRWLVTRPELMLSSTSSETII